MDESEYRNICKNFNKYPNFKEENGILYRLEGERKLQVIRDYEFEGLMYMVHDHELSGHFGVKATQNRVKENYWWKGMMKDIEGYVKSCEKCQKRGKPQGKHELHNVEIDEPFARIGIDIVGPLPPTEKGNRYIVVAMDYFTKWPEARALQRATAKEVATFIYEDIICRHGCPKRILTDRGTHFNNRMVKELVEKFEFKHGFSTPYHPKTNGLVERFNKTLCESLAKLGEENWDEHISPVLFAYRTKIQESTKMKPFYLVYGREARFPINNDDNKVSLLERVKYLLGKFPKERYKAKLNVKETQMKQKDYHDSKVKKKHEFNVGDKVLLYDAAREHWYSGKLQDKWRGPYYVHEVIVNGSYKIKELDGKIRKTPVNGELLKLYVSRNG